MASMMMGEAAFQTADGRKWELVLDFYAFVVAQQSLGCATLAELMARMAPVLDKNSGAIVREPDAIALGALLRAGLAGKHPELSEREAVNLLGSGDAAVGEALAKAMQGAFPDAFKQAPSAVGNGRGTGTKPKPTGPELV
jgi:hypothetical protein